MYRKKMVEKGITVKVALLILTSKNFYRSDLEEVTFSSKNNY